MYYACVDNSMFDTLCYIAFNNMYFVHVDNSMLDMTKQVHLLCTYGMHQLMTCKGALVIPQLCDVTITCLVTISVVIIVAIVSNIRLVSKIC